MKRYSSITEKCTNIVMVLWVTVHLTTLATSSWPPDFWRSPIWWFVLPQTRTIHNTDNVMNSMTHRLSVTMFLGYGFCQILVKFSRSRHRSGVGSLQGQSDMISKSVTSSGPHLPWISGLCQIYRRDRRKDWHCHMVLAVHSSLDWAWHRLFRSNWFYLCVRSMTRYRSPGKHMGFLETCGHRFYPSNSSPVSLLF